MGIWNEEIQIACLSFSLSLWLHIDGNTQKHETGNERRLASFGQDFQRPLGVEYLFPIKFHLSYWEYTPFRRILVILSNPHGSSLHKLHQ